MKVYITLFSSASIGDDISSIDRISTIEIELDHECEWTMPDDLSIDQQNCISECMEKYIREKWEPETSDPDDYYDFNREEQ